MTFIKLVKKYFTNIILCLTLVIVFFNFFLNILQNKEKIINKLSKYRKIDSLRSEQYKEYDYNVMDKYWTDEISKGGYILFFRHAEREKWPIIMSYDAYEMYENLRAEETSFARAVCLSSQGTEQAKIMGFYIKKSKMKISEVISSPSCRARQTSILAFDKISKISNYLVHYGPWNETREEHLSAVKKFLKEIVLKDDANVIISAHNGVLQKYLFDKLDFPEKNFVVDEGGFYVISKDRNNKIILKYKFDSFLNFSMYLVKRETKN